MRIIGLCGRSGSGKTTVADIYKSLGCDIIDADKIARLVMGVGSKCVCELAERFGGDIIKQSGELDRKLLASRAFASKEGASALNSITHKYIVLEIENRIKSSEKDNVIIDAPLLFEAGLQDKCNAIIGVIAPDELCVKRAANRDGVSEAEVESRLSNQHGNDYLLTYCTHIINNSDSLEKLKTNAENVLSSIIKG